MAIRDLFKAESYKTKVKAVTFAPEAAIRESDLVEGETCPAALYITRGNILFNGFMQEFELYKNPEQAASDLKKKEKHLVRKNPEGKRRIREAEELIILANAYQGFFHLTKEDMQNGKFLTREEKDFDWKIDQAKRTAQSCLGRQEAERIGSLVKKISFSHQFA